MEGLIAAVQAGGLAGDPGVREQVGGLVADGLAGSLMDLRSVLTQLRGEAAAHQAAVRKLVGVAHRQSVAETALTLSGPEGAAVAKLPLPALPHAHIREQVRPTTHQSRQGGDLRGAEVEVGTEICQQAAPETDQRAVRLARGANVIDLVAPMRHGGQVLAALFEPALDLVLGEADIRLDPHIRYKSALYIRINRLAVNLQHRFEVFGRQHIGQSLEACEHWRAMVHQATPWFWCCTSLSSRFLSLLETAFSVSHPQQCAHNASAAVDGFRPGQSNILPRPTDFSFS